MKSPLLWLLQRLSPLLLPFLQRQRAFYGRPKITPNRDHPPATADAAGVAGAVGTNVKTRAAMRISKYGPPSPGTKNCADSSRRRDRDEEHFSKKHKGEAWGSMDRRAAEDDGLPKEDRQPKRKVAVMMSYCGSGYRGMQVNPPHKSIEGDLFEAFVKAGAISRANSNDPKKSSLVRCARTDKGVHAAGNLISLKLIIEDSDIIKKINEALPAQIRVWDIIRTTGSFSAYQICDSRKYEYLMPSHVFLPPHPSTFLAKACQQAAIDENDFDNYKARQEDVWTWWAEVDEKILAELPGETKESIRAALEKESESSVDSEYAVPAATTEDAAMTDASATTEPAPEDPKVILLRKIRALHAKYKNTYRLSPARLAAIQHALSLYEGTNNFHNFTVNKAPRDKSAQRHIKSFVVQPPITINNTEWLSVKVHGQSFMMHQIRKMVGLVMMAVRCGAPPDLIPQLFEHRKTSIGKAPGLGLHLEHPLFDHYNDKIAKENGRDPLDFAKYKEGIEEFRKEWIYGKIFEEEEKCGTFGNFVQFLDTYKNDTYLYLTSRGLKAVEGLKGKAMEAPEEQDDSDEEGGDS